MQDFIIEVVEGYGLLAVFGLTVIENIIFPLPSEVILPLAGYLSANGKMNAFGAVAAATSGSTAGALVLYYLGRWLGIERVRQWAGRRGKWLLITEQDVAQAERWFDKHGHWAVFFCRLVPGVRSLISIPAGTAGMKISLFIGWTAAGTCAWSVLLVGLGRMLGQSYGSLAQAISWAGFGVAVLLVLSIGSFFYRRRKMERAERSGVEAKQGV